MKKGKVFFRVDGSAQIGLGHLVRCMALAHMLHDTFEIVFVSLHIPPESVIELDTNNFAFIKISEESGFFEQLSGNYIVVLDGYHFDLAYQEKIKSAGCKLVCIDDLHDNGFVADLIINHAPGVKSEYYRAQPYTQFALGLDYVLLRHLFLEQAKKERVIKSIQTVMICFGGSDPRNITKVALEAVLNSQRFKRVIVVTGAAYIFETSIIPLLDQNTCEYHHAIGEAEMLNLMLRAELLIVPSSSILLESMSVKSKIISGIYIKNQRILFDSFKALGVFESAEDFSAEHINQAINRCFENNNEPRHQLIDGKSGIRLLNIFKQLAKENETKLRNIDENDLQKTFEWANNALIRKFSFNKEPIEYDTHKKWFLSKLNDKQCFYYIGELDGKEFGSIRFDVDNGKAKISYLVDPLFQNNGLGTILLKKGLDLLISQTDISIVYGEVFFENTASTKIFQKLGYTVELDASVNIAKFKKFIQ